jgi:hypothetical protein
MDTIDQDILNAFVTEIKEAAAEAAVNTVTQNTKTYISPMSTDKINRIAVAAGKSAAKAAENVIDEYSKNDEFLELFSNDSNEILKIFKKYVLIGAFEGTHAGVKAGNEAGERVGAEAGEFEGKQNGKNSGAIAGAKAGEKAGAIAGAEAGAKAGVEAGIEVAMPKSTQIQYDVSLIAKERGEQAGIQAGIHAGASAGADAGKNSNNTIRIMGMFFTPKKRLFCSIKVCKEPVNDDGFAYNIGEALKTQTKYQDYLKSLSVVKNEDIQVQNITSTNIVKELEKYRGVSLNSQFAGYMSLSYLIDQVKIPNNNVVVLWTKKVTRKDLKYFYGNEIEIEAIFTYTTLDDDGNKLQYKRVKRNGSVEIKSLIYIQAFTVNNLIEQHFRCVSGSNVFNWFYYTAKTVGLKCVKIRAIDDAMKFWIKVKFNFNLDTNDSIVLEPTSNGKKSKKNKEQKNRTKKIKQKIKKYEKQLLSGEIDESVQLRQEINNLKLEENITSAEMLRENTSADKSTSLEVVMNSVENFGKMFGK